MNVREKARRSDALHYDYISRRDLCNMIANLESDLEDEKAESAKLRELLQRLLTEYRYMRVRPRAMYLQHEGRMRAIEKEMRELGMEVED